ncbi:MAG TPA: phosphotransferase [Chloroflexota bacterium]
MPDTLKLTAVLEASAPARMAPQLAPFFAGADGQPTIDMTRLQPPICYWAVYRRGAERVTFKSFFAGADYEPYVAKLREYYSDRVGRPDHPGGGLAFLPELNGVLWKFPFDPAMPGLGRALDGDWIAEAVRRPARALTPELLDYNPEIGAVLVYRDERGRRTVFGKVSPTDTAGLEYLVMDELWRSPARQRGDLLVSRPLAYRHELGLLLQARVRGRPFIGRRNSRSYIELAAAAGAAAAALHSTEVAIGPERDLEHFLARLADGLDELALTAPPLHVSMRRLIEQIRVRAARTLPDGPVPSHGDLKYDQLLRYRRRFILIDFEMFCRAEPWLDVGHFCAYLPPSTPDDWRDGAAAELARARFLGAYQRAAGQPINWERLALYEAAVLALRGLSYVWAHDLDWQIRASAMIDLAFERLVSPEPGANVEGLLPV